MSGWLAELHRRLRPLDAAFSDEPWNLEELADLLPPESPRVPAAVLVPLIRHADRTRLLLTRRTDTLATHAGQIAFPGGRIEAADANAVAAALRETREEVGLDPTQVHPLGLLDAYDTITAFRVCPVVGYSEGPLELRPDPTEVAEAFEIPLDFFLDPANLQRRSKHYAGRERQYMVYEIDGHFIWGATAAMIYNLARRLNPEGPWEP
jgi:8-oxo-dGTP pyrophosphatase MutT (NUDIX family)